MTPTEPAAEPQAADKAPAATPPGDPTTPATGQLQLLPLGEPAWIDSMGFELSLALAGSEPSGADWNRAELATQHALLAPNVAKFTPKAELAQRDGRRVLTLRFTRNTAELPDLAYDVLVADLVESSPVGLRIGWPQLGVALEVPAQFKRPDAPDADGEDADDAEL